MRDDFRANVRRLLADRAGHKCSVCLKTTSGPGETPDTALSDGIAAHITAASSDGPRYDASLSADARRSPENGIWVCTQHGREIDAATSIYSTGVLKGLKTKREAAASRELQQREGTEDQSSLLIEFPHASTTYKLFEVLAPQGFTYSTTCGIRDLFKHAERPRRLLELAPDLIVETWDSHHNVAGILSTLLTSNIDYWKPTPVVLDKLEQLCEVVIRSDEWTRVALVEPLAFAVAAQGRPRAHRNLLERLVTNPSWRDADAARERQYYGGIGIQIAALFRHWSDPYRRGLLRANDVGRLIDLLLSNDKNLVRPLSRQALLDLLAKHVQVLSVSGAADLARSVNALVEALEFRKDTTETY